MVRADPDARPPVEEPFRGFLYGRGLLVKAVTDATMPFRSNCSRIEGIYVIEHQPNATLSSNLSGQHSIRAKNYSVQRILQGLEAHATAPATLNPERGRRPRKAVTSLNVDDRQGPGLVALSNSAKSSHVILKMVFAGQGNPCCRHHPWKAIHPHTCAGYTEAVSLRVDLCSQERYSDRRSEPFPSPGAGTLQPKFNIISLINKVITLRHWIQPN